MEINNLYKFIRDDGGTTISTTMPQSSDYTTIYRIIAGENMSVTKDGLNFYQAIDTDTSVGWYEVETSFSEPEERGNAISAIKSEPMLVTLITKQINTLSVDDETSLRWKPLYPVWQTGISYQINDKEQWLGKLYRCLQAHTSQGGWEPDNTPALWTEINELHEGTIEDPINYSGNMILENGKYYKQYDVIYHCIRDTINPVYNPLSELVGLYVEVA